MQKNFEAKLLRWIYRKLYRTFGKRHWWPAETPFEVIVGAILTQGTNWSNVEKAMHRLRQKNWLSPGRLQRLKASCLARAIRPSGFFNVKAKRLKQFLVFFYRHWNGDLNKMFRAPTQSLRNRLLAVPGLGEETVDSILLYAGRKPIFVVDAYTRRILSRHGLIPHDKTYEAIQNLFMKSLPRRNALFNEYHALLVEAGKRYCRKTPLCQNCPLDVLPRTKRRCRTFVKRMKEEQP